VVAESSVSVEPALGAASGAPPRLGGGGGLPAGVGAPPVEAETIAAGPARIAVNAKIDADTASQALRTTCPLFRSPAELAVGLALKEMRYGSFFVRFAPGTCKAPAVPPLPSDGRTGFGYVYVCWRGSIDSIPAAELVRAYLIRRLSSRSRWDLPRGFSLMKTYVATPVDRQRDWYVVDAEGQTLGRLATRIADALRGKRKPEYTPHVDTGDFVVVVNAEKIRVTGKKMEQKRYWRHSGYPGGIKSRTLAEMLDRRPEEVIRKAVKGMLPRNRLARKQLTKLKVYAGPDHPHAAQKPKQMEIA
jgi:large subunit ribosomal protein L13